MKKKSFFLLIILGLAHFLFSDDYPRDTNLDIIHYQFCLTLDDTADSIKGKATITFWFVEKEGHRIALDLRGGTSHTGMQVSAVFINARLLKYYHVNNRLEITLPESGQIKKQIQVSIHYSGIPVDGLIIKKLESGKKSFFADNWPDRASSWLPCVDHPSDKATCEFIIQAPSHYQVVANGVLRQIRDLKDNFRLTHWQSTRELPTKIMIIGVAQFSVTHLGLDQGISVQNWLFPEDAKKGLIDFAPMPKVLDFFSDFIGPFPYAKIASVQSTTRYGGMENASAIFYAQRAIKGKGQIEYLIAHEMAHQWFGDSLTERDWHHIWLSEGFATYFTVIYKEFLKGKQFLSTEMERSRKRVLAFYKNNPQSAVVDTRIKDLNRLLNANSYNKGAWVLHMLRHLMGDDCFFKGIRSYYKKYKHKTVLTQDFQLVMEDEIKKDMDWFFEQWVYGPGIPKLQGGWQFLPQKRVLKIDLKQIPQNGKIFRFFLEIGIRLANREKLKLHRVEIYKNQHVFLFPLKTKPVHVYLDPRVWSLYSADFSER